MTINTAEIITASEIAVAVPAPLTRSFRFRLVSGGWALVDGASSIWCTATIFSTSVVEIRRNFPLLATEIEKLLAGCDARQPNLTSQVSVSEQLQCWVQFCPNVLIGHGALHLKM